MRNLDNDRFQELVLEQLKNLAKGQSQLQLQVTGIEKQLNSLAEEQSQLQIQVTGATNRLDGIEKQLNGLAEEQSQLQLQITGATSRLDGIEKQLNGLEQDVKRMEIRMENEIIDKIRALYDARSVQEDVNSRIINTLDRIEAKLDVLQMETAHIRRIIRRNKGI